MMLDFILFYQNNSNGTFTLNNACIPNDFAYSYSNAIGDTDNDGYPEIIVNNISHNNIFVLKNNCPQNNKWLKVKLEGTISNKQGIGSFIEISVNGDKQYRYTLCGEGYLSQNSATEFFGLESNTIIDYVKVKWLSGIEDIIYDVNVNQTLNIVEGETLSVQEIEANKFSLFPNPTNSIINLKATETIKKIEIFNGLGQRVLSRTTSNLQEHIDISNYENGVYYIKIYSHSSNQTSKIIKQ